MKPKIPWLRVFVEGVVIVGSILLAFGIDAAWEGRQEEVEAQSLLEGLQVELQAQRIELVNQLASTEELVTGLEPIIQGTPLTPDMVYDGLHQALSFWEWDPGSGLLLESFLDRHLEAIRDPQLREQLASWPGVKDEVVDNQRMMLDFTLLRLSPLLTSKHVPAWKLWAERAALTPEEEVTVRQMFAEAEVRGLLATKLQVFRVSVGDIRRAIVAADEIIRLLDRELGSPAPN